MLDKEQKGKSAGQDRPGDGAKPQDTQAAQPEKKAEKKPSASTEKKETGKVESDTFKKEVLTEKDVKAREAAKTQQKKKRQKRRKLIIKIAVVIVILIAAVVGWNLYQANQKRQEAQAEIASNTTTVTRMNITSELTGSGTLQAKDTYSITSLVEGEIISDNFSEGDIVEKGQVLYEIDSSSMDTTIKNSDTSLSRAQSNYEEAVADLSEAQSKYSGNTYKATESGYIKNLYVEAGDKVSNNAQIADIYDDTTMLLKVPFLNHEAQTIPAGADVVVTLSETGEQLPGKVKSVSTLDETLNGGVIVRYVTVYVSNPGGLSTSDTGFVTYGELISAEDGSFTPNIENVMNADLDGSVEIAAMLVNEGDYVTKGQAIFQITQDSMNDLLDTFQKNLETAEDNLEQAQNNRQDADDNLEDYTITAPISGTVISKNSKVGDKISRSGSTTTTMAEIYDLSELTFEMSIDELDIGKVEVGQKVKVVADAYEDQEFEGEVTNVSMLASNANGVTNYPVTVTIKDTGDLLPGMNVDGTIVLSESENALVIPADALQRGNVVYVKSTSASAAAAQTSASSETAEAAVPESGAASEAGSENAVAAPEGAPGEMPEGAQDGEVPENAELPSGGMQGGDTGSISAAVLERMPEGFTAVRVETGITNDDYVEILSGLSEGDEIYYELSDDSSGFGAFMMGGGMGGGPGGGGGMGGGPGGGPQ